MIADKKVVRVQIGLFVLRNGSILKIDPVVFYEMLFGATLGFAHW